MFLFVSKISELPELAIILPILCIKLLNRQLSFILCIELSKLAIILPILYIEYPKVGIQCSNYLYIAHSRTRHMISQQMRPNCRRQKGLVENEKEVCAFY